MEPMQIPSGAAVARVRVPSPRWSQALAGASRVYSRVAGTRRRSPACVLWVEALFAGSWP